MNAQAVLRGAPLQVASRAGVLLRGSVLVRPRVSFGTVRAWNSDAIAAASKFRHSRLFLRGNGLRAGSLGSLRRSPPSSLFTMRRQFSLNPVAVVAPAPPKMGMRHFLSPVFDCSVFCDFAGLDCNGSHAMLHKFESCWVIKRFSKWY